MATAIRAAPCAVDQLARRTPDRQSAAVPMTARAAPASRTSATARRPAGRRRPRPGRRSPTAADDRRDRARVCRDARPRGIEIDDVEPRRARVAKLERGRDRIRVVCRLAVEVALDEPDHATPTQVDRRQDVERSCVLHGGIMYRSSTLIRYYGANRTARRARRRRRWPTTGRPTTLEALFAAVLRLETVDEAERFFRDLCTLNELRDMAQRWAVVRMLDSGLHYAEISRTTGASTATITRIASWLNHGEGGYRAMLDKLDASSRAGTTPYPVAGDR